MTEGSCGYIDAEMNSGLGVNMHMCATSYSDVQCFNPSDAMQEFCESHDEIVVLCW